MPPTRLKYDGLTEEQHTFTSMETPDGSFVIEDNIKKDQVIEVADLNGPSERAKICRGHVARGIAHVVTEEKAKKATGKPSA